MNELTKELPLDEVVKLLTPLMGKGYRLRCSHVTRNLAIFNRKGECVAAIDFLLPPGELEWFVDQADNQS